MLRVILVLLLILPVIFSSIGQVGGQYQFSFLDIPVSARSSALGGTSVGFKDNDINLVYDNPSNLDSSLHQNFSVNYINYISNVNAGSFYYTNRFKKGALGVGLQFLGYGKFDQRDAAGNSLGEFKAGDYALNVGYGRSFDSVWSVGANLKLLYGSYYTQSAWGAAIDLGAGFKSRKGLFTAGLVAKNIGFANVSGPEEAGDLPFQVQIGLSQRVPRSPFRFHLQYHYLNKWDLGSNDPNYSGGTRVDPKTEEESFKTFTTDNLFRHIVIGTDLVFGKNFYATVAYNIRRRKELVFDQRAGLTGFSLGVGMKIKRLQFNYSYAQYTAKGGSSHIGISTNFGEYFTKR